MTRHLCRLHECYLEAVPIPPPGLAGPRRVADSPRPAGHAERLRHGGRAGLPLLAFRCDAPDLVWAPRAPPNAAATRLMSSGPSRFVPAGGFPAFTVFLREVATWGQGLAYLPGLVTPSESSSVRQYLRVEEGRGGNGRAKVVLVVPAQGAPLPSDPVNPMTPVNQRHPLRWRRESLQI